MKKEEKNSWMLIGMHKISAVVNWPWSRFQRGSHRHHTLPLHVINIPLHLLTLWGSRPGARQAKLNKGTHTRTPLPLTSALFFPSIVFYHGLFTIQCITSHARHSRVTNASPLTLSNHYKYTHILAQVHKQIYIKVIKVYINMSILYAYQQYMKLQKSKKLHADFYTVDKYSVVWNDDVAFKQVSSFYKLSGLPD